MSATVIHCTRSDHASEWQALQEVYEVVEVHERASVQKEATHQPHATSNTCVHERAHDCTHGCQMPATSTLMVALSIRMQETPSESAVRSGVEHMSERHKHRKYRQVWWLGSPPNESQCGRQHIIRGPTPPTSAHRSEAHGENACTMQTGSSGCEAVLDI